MRRRLAFMIHVSVAEEGSGETSLVVSLGRRRKKKPQSSHQRIMTILSTTRQILYTNISSVACPELDFVGCRKLFFVRKIVHCRWLLRNDHNTNTVGAEALGLRSRGAWNVKGAFTYARSQLHNPLRANDFWTREDSCKDCICIRRHDYRNKQEACRPARLCEQRHQRPPMTEARLTSPQDPAGDQIFEVPELADDVSTLRVGIS